MSELGFVVGGRVGAENGCQFLWILVWRGGKWCDGMSIFLDWVVWGEGGGVNPYFLIEMNVEAYQHVCSHDINV